MQTLIEKVLTYLIFAQTEVILQFVYFHHQLGVFLA